MHFQGATFGCFRSFISACFVTKTLMRIPVFSCFFPSLTSSHQIAFYYLLLSVLGVAGVGQAHELENAYLQI